MSAIESHSYIGVIIAIMGNFLIAVALNIQKHVHNQLQQSAEQLPLLLEQQEEQTERNNTASYINSPLWWIGQLVMTVGEAGNFTAYGFSPAVLVAPLGTVALITNAVIAPLFLGELLRMQDVFGIIISVIGTIIIVVVSSHTQEPGLNFQLIIDAVCQFEFIVYVILTAFLLILLLQVSFNSVGKNVIWVDLSIGAICGGYTVLATKAVASLLKLNLYLVFEHWLTYVLLFVMLLTAVLQVQFLNRSLARFDSVQVIPTNFVLFTTSSIIGSSVLYHDLQRTNPLALTGIMCMFLGVFMITSRPERSSDLEHIAPVASFENSERHSAGIAIQTRQQKPVAYSMPVPSAMRSPELVRIGSVGRADLTALRRLSIVLDSVGTHQVRRIELDYFADSPEWKL